jgi:hypothetical protein
MISIGNPKKTSPGDFESRARMRNWCRFQKGC